MSKKILYVDMDGVIVDFYNEVIELNDYIKQKYENRLDEIPGIFENIRPIEGSIESVRKLSEYFDLYVLSTAPWKNTSSWTDKVKWIQKYFGDDKDSPIYKRLILSHHKHLNKGDFLVDDRDKNGAGEFEGEIILFGSEKFKDWENVTEYLISKA